MSQSKNIQLEWEEIDGIFVPFVTRWNGKEYSEINMLLKTLYKKHMDIMDKSVFYIACPLPYDMLPYEITLFNKINQIHHFIDGSYKMGSYFLLDRHNAMLLYEVLNELHNMIVYKTIKGNKCGYIKFDGSETPIPFADCSNNGKIVPAFVFDFTQFSNVGFELIHDTWATNRLKLCLKLLGIPIPSSDKPNMKVIKLDKLIKLDPTLKYRHLYHLPDSVNLAEILKMNRSNAEEVELENAWINSLKEQISHQRKVIKTSLIISKSTDKDQNITTDTNSETVKEVVNESHNTKTTPDNSQLKNAANECSKVIENISMNTKRKSINTVRNVTRVKYKIPKLSCQSTTLTDVIDLTDIDQCSESTVQTQETCNRVYESDLLVKQKCIAKNNQECGETDSIVQTNVEELIENSNNPIEIVYIECTKNNKEINSIVNKSSLVNNTEHKIKCKIIKTFTKDLYKSGNESIETGTVTDNNFFSAINSASLEPIYIDEPVTGNEIDPLAIAENQCTDKSLLNDGLKPHSTLNTINEEKLKGKSLSSPISKNVPEQTVTLDEAHVDQTKQYLRVRSMKDLEKPVNNTNAKTNSISSTDLSNIVKALYSNSKIRTRFKENSDFPNLNIKIVGKIGSKPIPIQPNQKNPLNVLTDENNVILVDSDTETTDNQELINTCKNSDGTTNQPINKLKPLTNREVLASNTTDTDELIMKVGNSECNLNGNILNNSSTVPKKILPTLCINVKKIAEINRELNKSVEYKVSHINFENNFFFCISKTFRNADNLLISAEEILMRLFSHVPSNRFFTVANEIGIDFYYLNNYQKSILKELYDVIDDLDVSDRYYFLFNQFNSCYVKLKDKLKTIK